MKQGQLSLTGKKPSGIETIQSELKASESNQIRKGSWKLVEVDKDDQEAIRRTGSLDHIS